MSPDNDMIERLDALAERLRASGIDANRDLAARACLITGLDAMEQRMATPEATATLEGVLANLRAGAEMRSTQDTAAGALAAITGQPSPKDDGTAKGFLGTLAGAVRAGVEGGAGGGETGETAGDAIARIAAAVR